MQLTSKLSVLWLVPALLAVRAVADAGDVPVYREVVGREFTHVVSAGETLGHLAPAAGMSTQLAAAMNRLEDPHRLRLGQRLRLSNRHIVPSTATADGIIINLSELTLYWRHDGTIVDLFPIGAGRRDWQTPPGHYQITSRRRDPVWTVPPSIRREMREKGQPVKEKVPPGPDNPLGKYWLQLSLPGYGIHGTNAPRSVGKYTTHGCIRLLAEHSERLYLGVPNGTPVDIIEEPIKIAQLDDGTVLLETHPGASDAVTQRYLHQIEGMPVAEFIDWAKAKRVIGDAWGRAIDVSKRNQPTTTLAEAGKPFDRSKHDIP